MIPLPEDAWKGIPTGYNVQDGIVTEEEQARRKQQSKMAKKNARMRKSEAGAAAAALPCQQGQMPEGKSDEEDEEDDVWYLRPEDDEGQAARACQHLSQKSHQDWSAVPSFWQWSQQQSSHHCAHQHWGQQQSLQAQHWSAASSHGPSGRRDGPAGAWQ